MSLNFGSMSRDEQDALSSGSVPPEEVFVVSNRRGGYVMDGREVTLHFIGDVATLDGWQPVVINIPISETSVVEDHTYNSDSVNRYRQKYIDEYVEELEKKRNEEKRRGNRNADSEWD